MKLQHCKGRLCVVFAALLAGYANTSVDVGAAERPNVLFLICDDLNCDMGCYGHAMVKTPNIDALAADGVLFERAYCQYPLCGPSRASFMTGMYPDQTLVRRNAIYIREHVPNVKTIPQMYRDAGYTATRIGKIYHYNVPKHIGTSGHDDPYSWNNTVNPEGRDVHDEDRIFSLTPGSFGGTLSWLAADGTDDEQTDGIAALEADKTLRRFAKDRTPFFLAVGLYRPHTPYVAPKKYFDMYPLDQIVIPEVPDGYLASLPEPARKSLTRKKQQNKLDPKLARQAIQAYYASITFADAQVGRILNSLRQTGLSKNTIVVFTSDHGYHMGEHDYYQKLTLFENATRVPLIMSGPGVTAVGTKSASFAEMVDFYPTLAELSDLTPPPSASGVSLATALRDPRAVPRKSAISQLDNRNYSLRTPQYRYTEWGENGKDGVELYDQSVDAGEMHNLAAQPTPELKNVIQRLSAELRKRIVNSRKPPQGVKQLDFRNTRKVPQR